MVRRELSDTEQMELEKFVVNNFSEEGYVALAIDLMKNLRPLVKSSQALEIMDQVVGVLEGCIPWHGDIWRSSYALVDVKPLSTQEILSLSPEEEDEDRTKRLLASLIHAFAQLASWVYSPVIGVPAQANLRFFLKNGLQSAMLIDSTITRYSIMGCMSPEYSLESDSDEPQQVD